MTPTIRSGQHPMDNAKRDLQWESPADEKAPHVKEVGE